MAGDCKYNDEISSKTLFAIGNVSSDSLEEVIQEGLFLCEVGRKILDDKLLATFAMGSPFIVDEKKVNIFETSLEEINMELNKHKEEVYEEKLKKELKIINEVRFAGGTFGKFYIALKKKRGFYYLGKEESDDEFYMAMNFAPDYVKLLETNFIDNLRVAKIIYKSLNSCVSFMDLNRLYVKIDSALSNIAISNEKAILDKGINNTLEEINKIVIYSARRIVKAKSKDIRKNLKKVEIEIQRLSKIVIRSFDRDVYKSALNHHMNSFKSVLGTLNSSLNSLLSSNKTYSIKVINRIKSLERSIIKEKGNIKDFQVLERIAFNRYNSMLKYED